jgi:hypothetical protein
MRFDPDLAEMRFDPDLVDLEKPGFELSPQRGSLARNHIFLENRASGFLGKKRCRGFDDQSDECARGNDPPRPMSQ